MVSSRSSDAYADGTRNLGWSSTFMRAPRRVPHVENADNRCCAGNADAEPQGNVGAAPTLPSVGRIAALAGSGPSSCQGPAHLPL